MRNLMKDSSVSASAVSYFQLMVFMEKKKKIENNYP